MVIRYALQSSPEQLLPTITSHPQKIFPSSLAIAAQHDVPGLSRLRARDGEPYDFRAASVQLIPHLLDRSSPRSPDQNRPVAWRRSARPHPWHKAILGPFWQLNADEHTRLIREATQNGTAQRF